MYCPSAVLATGPDETIRCFAIYRGRILTGYADEVISEVTLDQCEQACLGSQTQFSIACNSFMYFDDERTCILNEVTKDANPSLFTRDQDADYYEKLATCPDSRRESLLYCPVPSAHSQTLLGYC